MTVTLQDQIACARREVGMRKRVYSKWVEAKRMKKETADKETAGMEAIEKTLQAIAITATVTIDALALRKVVGFELAEIILDARPSQGKML